MLYTSLCVMAATIAINTILIFTLLATFSWDQRAMFLFATALLSGGLFFTIRTMQRLKKPN